MSSPSFLTLFWKSIYESIIKVNFSELYCNQNCQCEQVNLLLLHFCVITYMIILSNFILFFFCKGFGKVEKRRTLLTGHTQIHLFCQNIPEMRRLYNLFSATLYKNIKYQCKYWPFCPRIIWLIKETRFWYFHRR